MRLFTLILLLVSMAAVALAALLWVSANQQPVTLQLLIAPPITLSAGVMTILALALGCVCGLLLGNGLVRLFSARWRLARLESQLREAQLALAGKKQQEIRPLSKPGNMT